MGSAVKLFPPNPPHALEACFAGEPHHPSEHEWAHSKSALRASHHASAEQSARRVFIGIQPRSPVLLLQATSYEPPATRYYLSTHPTKIRILKIP